MSIRTVRRALRAALAATLVLHATPAAATPVRECSPLVSMDERAQCFLATPAGRRALAAVGERAPADLEARQAFAALTPSFARYVIRTAGLAKAQPALEAATADAYPKFTGKTLAEWRTEWVAFLGTGRTAG